MGREYPALFPSTEIRSAVEVDTLLSAVWCLVEPVCSQCVIGGGDWIIGAAASRIALRSPVCGG